MARGTKRPHQRIPQPHLSHRPQMLATTVRFLLTFASLTFSFLKLLPQNKLDFQKIDSFHGTGAFNLTLFPEWDSLFLDLATQDPEKVIIEVARTRKTRRGWGNQGGYFENMTSASASCSPAATTTTPWTAPSNQHRPAPGTGKYNIYRATWKTSSSTTDKDDSSPDAAPKKTVPRSVGVQGNYMESLIQQKRMLEDGEKINPENRRKKRTGRKTRKERELALMQKKAEQVQEQLGDLPPSKSKCLGYLETLLSNTNEGASDPSERRENPYLEEVSYVMSKRGRLYQYQAHSIYSPG